MTKYPVGLSAATLLAVSWLAPLSGSASETISAPGVEVKILADSTWQRVELPDEMVVFVMVEYDSTLLAVAPRALPPSKKDLTKERIERALGSLVGSQNRRPVEQMSDDRFFASGQTNGKDGKGTLYAWVKGRQIGKRELLFVVFTTSIASGERTESAVDLTLKKIESIARSAKLSKE